MIGREELERFHLSMGCYFWTFISFCFPVSTVFCVRSRMHKKAPWDIQVVILSKLEVFGF